MNTVVTDEMFDRSVVNRGNLYRIEKLISKAKRRGDNICIARRLDNAGCSREQQRDLLRFSCRKIP